MGLTEERWTVLEPLVEACRAHAKVPPQHLRPSMGAILWRHDKGAKWRALRAGEGPWWMAAQTFIRCSGPEVFGNACSPWRRSEVSGSA